MVKVEKINHKQGWYRLFYTLEFRKTENLFIHCYIPGERKVSCKVKQLEDELYFFDFHFRHLGEYVFICFEDEKKTLIIIVTIKNENSICK